MVEIMICPVCTQPVADQPASGFDSAYRSAINPWWHLATDTPICPASDGSLSQPVSIEDGMPAEAATTDWLDTMRELFAHDGPYSPSRLGAAIAAAGHLDRWLHMATGPISAMTALPTPADVAFVIGHLHRTSRLLARVHAQTQSYLLDYAHQRRPTGSGDQNGTSGEVIDVADEVRVLLQDAAELSAASARETGIAWSYARKIAAATATWPATVPPSPTDKHDASPDLPTGTTWRALTNLARRLWRQTRPRSTRNHLTSEAKTNQRTSDMFEASAELLAAQISSAFGDEATFSPQLTQTAARSMGTLISYLANCLGGARATAVPTARDLADLATSLTYFTHTLSGGLRHLADSPRSLDGYGLDETHAYAARASLNEAINGLSFTAQHLGAASYATAGLDLPEDHQ
ncbi:hypothetical protein [Plantactinospora sp. CA-290183]|uniref:hypothetical protein n=1 Tax=Plantactinospora sp. CA-290183 TaxID=3240006 RepID=UPI003D89D1D0